MIEYINEFSRKKLASTLIAVCEIISYISILCMKIINIKKLELVIQMTKNRRAKTSLNYFIN